MEVSDGIFTIEVSNVIIPVFDTFKDDLNSLLNQYGKGIVINEDHLGMVSDAL